METITILLVEDDPNQRRLYQMELEDEGYRVVLASEGREALQYVKEEAPDLVVLDLRMPGMDGVETLGRMVALNSRLPVIIYSAYDRFKDNFMTWPADAYVVKNSNLDLLKAEIRRVLSKREVSVPQGGGRATERFTGSFSPPNPGESSRVVEDAEDAEKNQNGRNIR